MYITFNFVLFFEIIVSILKILFFCVKFFGKIYLLQRINKIYLSYKTKFC